MQAFMKMTGCCGMLGGLPDKALYFLGASHDRLMYLDPHTVQTAVDMFVDDDEVR